MARRKKKTTKVVARDSVTLDSVFTSIANAIRSVSDTSSSIAPRNMGNAIRAIKSIQAASLPEANLPAVFTDIANAIRACGVSGTMTISQMIENIPLLAYSLTIVSYTQASGLSDWSENISGTITGTNSSPYYTSQIPNVQYAKTISFGDNVTSITTRAFYGCSSLTSVTIGNNVTSIGLNVFANCSGLTNVTIPSGVTSIGNRAFYGCSGLTSVTIPDSVTNITSRAFSGCSGLMSFSVASDNPSYKEVSGLLLTKDGLTLVAAPGGLTGSLTISSGVTSIGQYAFEDCSSLTSVTIPDGVTSIERYAFFACSGLTNVTIPDSVTDIGMYAFSGCSGLTSVTISDSVTSIGSSAFYGCSGLTSVTIGNGVTKISNSMFYNCGNLTRITFGSYVTNIGTQVFRDCNCTIFDFRKSTSVPTLANINAFIGTPSNKEIIVPDSLYDSWVAASNWSSTSYNIVNCIVKASQSSLGTL